MNFELKFDISFLKMLQNLFSQILIFKLMKKKESTPKPSKSKVIPTVIKKGSTKPKAKLKQQKHQQSLLILLGDSFYVAASKSERKVYNQFQKRVKVSRSDHHKLPSRSNHVHNESINLQQYVKSLSKAEKQKLLMDLSKEMEIEKCDEAVEVSEKDDKLQRLNSKLESIRIQLMTRWQQQINQINHLFENEQISLQDKNQKIVLIEKIRNSKLMMIDYTRVLFQKILNEEGQLQLNKQQHIQHIINSIHSTSELDSLSQQINSIEGNRQIQRGSQIPIKEYEIQQYTASQNKNNEEFISKQKRDEYKYIYNRTKLLDNEPEEEDKESFLIEQQNVQVQSKTEKNQLNREGERIKIQDLQKNVQFNSNSPFRLEIRLDEVQFGKDHYDQQPAIALPEPSLSPSKTPEDIKLSFSRQHDDSNRRFIKKGEDQFLCVQFDKIKIPMLMTKDKLEQIQLQKTGQQIQALTIAMRNKQQFQHCSVIPENQQHFTTLMDVNQFVVSFYEFVVNNYMREVIEWMNIPFGKSCPDKLFSIRKEGYVQNYDFTNVLHRDFLEMYHSEINQSSKQTVKILSEYQKTHNLAIFDAFNSGLNLYRAYYELEGEVFPWNTSEKGLTFYQISDQNIEEVFEKTKMKILEACTILCGLMPICELTTDQSKQLLTKKHQETYERVLKTEVKEKFLQWNVQILNFQALVRLNLAEDIYQKELALLIEDLNKIKAA